MSMISLKLFVKKLLGRLYLRYFTLGKLLEITIDEIIEKYKHVLDQSTGEPIIKALLSHLDDGEYQNAVDTVKNAKSMIESIIKNIKEITATLQDVAQVCLEFLSKLPEEIAKLQAQLIKALSEAILDILSRLAQLLVDILMPSGDGKLPDDSPLEPLKTLVSAAANGDSPFKALKNM